MLFLQKKKLLDTTVDIFTIVAPRIPRIVFIGICPSIGKIPIGDKPSDHLLEKNAHFTRIPHVCESVDDVSQLIDRDLGGLVVFTIYPPRSRSQLRHFHISEAFCHQFAKYATLRYPTLVSA